MIYRFLLIGRRSGDPIQACVQRYQDRLKHFAKIYQTLLPESNPEQEAKALLQKITQGSLVIALDECGQPHTTCAMKNVLEHHRNLGMRDFTFIFGGSHGLHPQVLARANMSWSLSLLTLPHRLAWLVLTEQLFRIHTLWQGSPYHHGNRLGEAT